ELGGEAAAVAREVLVGLAGDGAERPRRAQHARAELPCQPLELSLRLRVEADAAETEVADADEERSDGRLVENVVRDVELAGRRCGSPEALVQNGRNFGGHRCSFSFRSRRTPAEAACRAACSFEPRAAPIVS